MSGSVGFPVQVREGGLNLFGFTRFAKVELKDGGYETFGFSKFGEVELEEGLWVGLVSELKIFWEGVLW